MERLASTATFKLPVPMPRSRDRPASRLGPEDWERAALGVLEADGLGAVTINRVAGALGVTKGSFYWHYESRDDLIASMLASWERQSTERAIETLGAVDDPRERLEALFVGALGSAPTIHLQLRAVADDPLVAPALRRATERRLDGLATTFRAMGMTPAAARDRAALAYAAYLGLADLRREGPPSTASEQGARRLARKALALLLPPSPS